MEDFLKFLDIGLESFGAGKNAQEFLWIFFLTFARFFAFVYVAPFIGGKLVPALVKIAVATALVVIVFPLIAADPGSGDAAALGAVRYAALLIKEIFVGFTLGFVASLVFEAARAAGRIADYQRGSRIGELFAPAETAEEADLGRFKFLLAIVIFVTSGAHLYFIGSLVKTFEVIPLSGFPAIETGWTPAAEFLAGLSAGVITLGVQLAAPVVIALLVAELLFGLMSRSAPEINAFLSGLPVKMWLGVFVLLVMLPFLFARINESFNSAFEAFEFVIRFFSSAGR